MMVNTKIKRTLCALTAAICLFTCTGEAVSAGTIPFTVTVGGSGTQDPLSKKEAKRDSEQAAYFTATNVGNPSRKISVKSYNKNNKNIYTFAATLSNDNSGQRQRKAYVGRNAPAKQYYYMKAEAVNGRVTVKGKYCP